MKRILLVDDDAFFRAMFSGLLAWDEMGYSLLQAENGQEGIALLHRFSDVCMVFTDMSMPVMDGVALLRFITGHFPAIHCVALSAYDDFEYVKSSFQSGVGDYLLKHTLTRQQIMDVLNKYAESGQGAPARSPDADQRARFLYDWITGRYPDQKESLWLLESLGLPPLRENLVLCLLTGDTPDGVIRFAGPADTTGTRLRTALSILQNLAERVGQGAAFRGPDDGLMYALLTAPGFENLNFAHQAAAVFGQQAEAAFQQYFNLKTHFFCAAVCRRAEGLREAHRELMRMTGRKDKNAEPEAKPSFTLPLPGFQVLRDALRFGDAQEIRSLLHAGFLEGRRQGCAAGDFTRFSLRCLSMLPGLADALGVQPPDTPPHDRVLASEGADAEQEEAVAQAFLALHGLAAARARSLYTPLVYGALCVMHRDLGDESLTVNRIASAVHANPAYLSRLFKAQTGQNISDYLNEQRIEKACRLLAEGKDSVRDVAAQCGFENYNYFFTVFKKHKGVTPKEYRAQAAPDPGAS